MICSISLDIYVWAIYGFDLLNKREIEREKVLMTWKMLVETIICQQEKQNRQNRMDWYASFPFFSPRLFFFVL